MIVENPLVSWARKSVDPKQASMTYHFTSNTHWSRWYEYSFVAANGDFQPRQWVLDAAGGDSLFQLFLSRIGCQVLNVDLDASRQLKSTKGIVNVVGDIKNLQNYQAKIFDRITCLSALEHIVKPMQVIEQLWRVLKDGGRLAVTFDVTDYARYTHTCSMEVASNILGYFGLELPSFPEDGISVTWPEYADDLPASKTVTIKVLCFAVTKSQNEKESA